MSKNYKTSDSKAKVFETPQFFKLGRLIIVGNGLFSRILFINGTFYAFVSLKGNTYYVRGFDQDWQFTGFEKRLTPEGESDIDQDIAFDGEYIYEYAMRRPQKGQDPHTSFRGGQIRKFDTEFNLVKTSPIFSGENEIVLDQNIEVIDGKIYAGSEYRENNALWIKQRREKGRSMQNIPPNRNLARATHLRIYDKDLNLLKEKDLIANIKGARIPHQYSGIGASQLYVDGHYYIVASSSTGNTQFFKRGARGVFLIRFDDDFEYVDSKGPLTDTDNDNYWCTGNWYENGRYYISYTCRRPGEKGGRGPGMQGEPGTFSRDQGNIRLSIFDKDFNELETINITNLTIKPNVITPAAQRSKILKLGNKLYVTYDIAQKSYLQELIQKT